METFKRILQYSKPYWWRIVISMAASLCVGGTDAAIAYMVEPLLKKIFTVKDMTIFTFLPLAVIAIFLFRGVARYIQEYYIRTASQLAIQDIRNEMYRKHMTFSLRYFFGNSVGALLSRVVSDVGQMQQGVASVITSLLRDGVTSIGLLGVIFYRDWQLALITFIVLPLTALPTQKIGRRIKVLSKQSLQQMGEITTILQETFSGIKVVKAFCQEQSAMDRFSQTNYGMYRNLRKSIKYAALHTPIMELITSLGVAGVIWFGGNRVMSGNMSASEFFSFLTAMVMLYTPVKRLLNSYNTVQLSVGAAERVFEALDQQPDIQDPVDPVPLDKARGDVAFCDVSFQYEEEYVLRDVSFTARRGEVVALVGPSGAGKTTVISLIPRFYDVTGGAVLIDGIDVRRLCLADLLRQIALVDQETILFNQTIGFNIRLGCPDAAQADVERAAQAAFAHDFIAEMPDGYETVIGDRGVRLSGGQRQRICIARAILKDAPILLLDEATSALDTESEHMVQQALANLMRNRTTLVIAHRLSTILHADRIIVIDKGEVAEVGTNDELLARNGIYRKLYDMQFA
jgi:ATP-binding cassette, subfamily B, bacterial MsbA